SDWSVSRLFRVAKISQVSCNRRILCAEPETISDRRRGHAWANCYKEVEMKTTAALLGLGMTVLLATGAAGQMVMEKKVITAEAARKVAEGCEVFAKARGWHVSVWVLDETLTPLYFYRMQGTPMFTVEPALAKAKVAVRTGQPNEAYVRNAETRGPFVATVNAIAGDRKSTRLNSS